MLKKRIVAVVIGIALIIAVVGASANAAEWLSESSTSGGQAIAANSGGGC